MSPNREDSPDRAFHYLVADAIEALIPLVDDWAAEVKSRRVGGAMRSYGQTYDAGVQDMASEVKDQLVERVLRLRQY